MPVVIYAPHKDGLHDGSIHKQTMAFISKLFEDDTLPGLHIEPINGCIDDKVRTGRVNDMYRAVLFRVQSSVGTTHYIFTGVWPHDEANSIAEKAVLKTNPVNGLPELLIGATTAVPSPGVTNRPPDQVDRTTTTAAAPPFLESVSAGTTLDKLTDVLGMDVDLAERALAATTEDELISLAADAVEWQGMALLELTSGGTIESVRASLGIDQDETQPADVADDEEDRLLHALRAPAAGMQFAWLEDDDELRAVVEGGDFAAWKVFLHPEQRRYVDGRYNGAFRLTGGAGTGKTVVLLHRARVLARREPGARIVLTTYTRTLAEAMRRDLLSLDPTLPMAGRLGDPGVFVTGVDAAASAVLSQAGNEAKDASVQRVLGVGGNRTGGRTNETEAWRDAASSAGGALLPSLAGPGFFAAEYDAVVLPHHVTTRDAYLRVRRPGRGVSLGRAQRGVVWDVVSSYRAAAAVDGTADFGEVCAIAADVLDTAAANGGRRTADHVLVDEGQDLTAVRWQLLRALVAEAPDDLFIAEDAEQRIYGQRVTLGRYGIKIVGRSRRLSLNYRTTHQVLGLAVGVLSGTDFHDLADELTHSATYRSARSGPVPRQIGLSSVTEELDVAATVVSEWLQENGVERSSIGVLVRDQRSADRVARGLDERGVKVRLITRGSTAAKDPQVMTMHRAKGMEFAKVLIFGADADVLPAKYLVANVADEDRDDLMRRERALFYVAATRARDELVVLWQGEGSLFLNPATGRRGR